MQQLSTKETLEVARPQQDPQHFETVIIDTGFSGLLAAIGLQKNNFNDFVLLERSAKIGGTWRDKAYPGAEVDVPTGLRNLERNLEKYIDDAELRQHMMPCRDCVTE